MMIMRFHKLIQSRLLWMVFLGILVCSFVLWGLASNTDTNPALDRLKRPVARIDGQEISFLKLDVTKSLLENQARQRIPDELLTERALSHLAMVAYAEKQGLGAPEDLATQQFFQGFIGEDGQLDEELLQSFRDNLRGSPLTEAEYIRFTQEGLTLSNLQRKMASYVLVPGFDVDRWAGSQTDSYTVQFAAITPEILTEEIVVTEEQKQKYFEENIERFKMPEERKVRFLSFHVDDFSDQVKEVTNEEALDYYMKRPELYVRTVTKPAEEEGGEESSVQEPIPYNEVKEQILESLKLEKIRKLAEETAMAFAVDLYPRRGKPGRSLDAIAEKAGLEVHTPKAFSMRDPVEGLENSFEFKQAAFKLDLSDLGKQGGPVAAGDQFVLIELLEIIPPRLPTYEQVASQVDMAAQSFHTREAVTAKAVELVEQIRTAVAEGADFEEELKKVELSAISPPPFEMRNMDPNRPVLPPELIGEVESARAGDVFGPIESRFGGSFIVYLAARTPNPEEAAELSPDVRNMLRAQLHFPEVFERFREAEIAPTIEMIEPVTGAKEEDAA